MIMGAIVYVVLLAMTSIVGGLECGQRVNWQPFIYNGEAADERQWPWHGALYFVNDTTKPDVNSYRCGSTLISSQWVVTAAHCTFLKRIALPPSRIILKFGLVNLNEPGNHSAERKVEQIFRYSDYDPVTLKRDIALLKSSKEVQFSDYIQPICLPSATEAENPSITGERGSITGWGKGEDDNIQTILKYASLRVISTEQCLLGKPEYFGRILDGKSNFCAGNKNQTNACHGDSGGGMYFKDGDSWFLRGIISTGNTPGLEDGTQCKVEEYITLTNLTYFRKWIDGIQHTKRSNLLELADCGVDDHHLEVLEHKKPMFLQYPWVTIQEYTFDEGNESQIMCSGALIHPQFVLVAGHCACESCDAIKLDAVRLGEFNLATNPDKENRLDEQETTYMQSIAVAKVIRHPEFDESLYSHDIALLKLAKLAPLKTSNVKPICLPLAEDYKEDFVVTGWKRAGAAASVLQRELVQLVDVDDCQLAYDRINVNLGEQGGVVCVERTEQKQQRKRDPLTECSNFMSGTPMQYVKEANGENRYFLKGLYAFGLSRCHQNLTDVFVNVVHYAEWIKETVNAELGKK